MQSSEGAQRIEQCRSVPAMVQASAARYGDRVAVIDGAVRLSFHDVATEMMRVAAALMARGVEPGDRVAIWAPNSVAWITSALGALASGAWLVPLNTRFKGPEAAFVLRKSNARVLFVADEFLGVDYVTMLRSADADLRALDGIVVLPRPQSYSGASWAAFLDAAAAVSADTVQARLDSIGPDDVSDIMFTSGTTGDPKGVMLRHGATLRGYQVYTERAGLGEHDTHLIALPFFHCFGYKAGWMASLMTGATTIPVSVFDPVAVMALIERERVTQMPGAPTMFLAIIEHPQRSNYDLSSLKTTMVGAATIPKEFLERLRTELAIDHALSGYGLTENHALVSIAMLDDPPEVVATTVGRLLPDLEVRVVDDAGDDVPNGTPGELFVRGYAQMSGYYDEPEATAAVIVDGWLHTGDIVSLDDADYVTFVDRKKDMVIVGGFNVSTAEVEKAVGRLEQISQVSVVGAHDAHFGEVVVAFVVPRPGALLEPDDVIAFARANVANYKVPRRVIIVDELPLNATGKVLKRELRRRLDEAGRAVPPANRAQ